MNPIIRTTFAAVSIAAFASMAAAQSKTPPTDQVDQHHVADQPADPAMPMAGQTGLMPGMMGSGQMIGMMGEPACRPDMMMNMGSMMQMMLQMMPVQRAESMEPFEHVEGRIAFLRTEIKITDTQKVLWDAFADALRQAAEGLQAMHVGAPRMSANNLARPTVAARGPVGRQSECGESGLECRKAALRFVHRRTETDRR